MKVQTRQRRDEHTFGYFAARAVLRSATVADEGRSRVVGRVDANGVRLAAETVIWTMVELKLEVAVGDRKQG